ncbi:MAG: alpha/beta-hydrolase family protein [Rhodobacter sp.]|nr:alpha/beta-hydrolase family protein [Rhodobacter sp.]
MFKPSINFLRSFTALGLILGTLFFAASLTPSLVPRHPAVQGVLSGFCLAAGYGLGVALRALWLALQLPVPADRTRRVGQVMAILLCAGLAALALWRASEWQNALRALMDMPPVDGARVLLLASLTLVVFVVLLVIGRLFGLSVRMMTARLGRLVPGPVAAITGLVLTAFLFWMIGNGVIVRQALKAFDTAYARLDALIEDGSPRPADPMKTGGPGSLLSWEGLGREGRAAIAAGPDKAQIEAMTGAPALEPLRVYVGLNSARTVQERAQLALDELIRIGAFKRTNLVIVTPTGTGWVDPESQTALEYVLRGDVASVSVQYSYLASWLALMVDPGYGVETARAVFAAVYGHWHNLPKDARPRLYLHGLSLGAFNSDLSHDLHQVIGDPYQGALWAGPPFPSRTWNNVTAARNPGTPAWLPEFRDGSVIRFTSQDNRLDNAPAPWGPYRIIYLQYASDAVTFFDPNALWRKPDWLAEPVGPDVSPDFAWIPVVTFLQLGIDIMLATTPPLGYGHTYAFKDYADSWASLTDAPGWTADSIAALKAKVAAEPP